MSTRFRQLSATLENMAEWKEQVLYWKRKLEKGVSTEKTLQILQKLQKVPISIALLQETGIGKVVNGLRKQDDGEIAEHARFLVSEWKRAVSHESSNEVAPPVVNHSQQRYSEQEHHRKHAETVKSNHSRNYASNHMDAEEEEDEDDEAAMHTSNYEEDEGDEYAENNLYIEGYDHQNQQASEEDQGSEMEQEEEDEEEVYSSKSRSNHIERSGSLNKHHYRENTSYGMEQKKNFHKGSKDSLSRDFAQKHSSSKPASSSQRHSEESRKSSNNKKDSADSHKKDKKVSPEKPAHRQDSASNHKSSKSSKSSSSNGSKEKSVILKAAHNSEGFDNSMASFEAILGLNDAMNMKKKKMVQTKHSDEKKKPSKTVTAPSSQTRPSSQPKKEEKSSKSVSSSSSSSNKRSREDNRSFAESIPKPKALQEVDILSTLPAIQPNYKPLPYREPESPPSKKKALSSEDALLLMTSKKDRTMVYSGRRTNYLTEVPSLYELCTKVLAENVDSLAYTGGVPYDILKPVLERCTPNQLYNLEDYNPYLLEDTDELWHIHCQRDFKGRHPDEGETWREMYLRLLDEREAKLKSVTANISASMAKAVPIRQTKLAYVETVAKPPRDVARRQAKYGTGLPVSHPLKAGPSSKATPRPMAPVINTAGSSSSSSSSQAKMKPKVAPLMQKTLKFMKSRFRR